MSLVKQKKRRASFWEYMGESPNGKDCCRANPYSYPLSLIRWLYYQRHSHKYQVKVTYSKADRFGHEVTVMATKDVWDSAYLDFAESLGNDLLSDWGVIVCVYKDDSEWAYSFNGEVICQLFDKCEGQTDLDVVKNGYAFFDQDGRRYFFKSSQLEYGS